MTAVRINMTSDQYVCLIHWHFCKQLVHASMCLCVAGQFLFMFGTRHCRMRINSIAMELALINLFISDLHVDVLKVI